MSLFLIVKLFGLHKKESDSTPPMEIAEEESGISDAAVPVNIPEE